MIARFRLNPARTNGQLARAGLAAAWLPLAGILTALAASMVFFLMLRPKPDDPDKLDHSNLAAEAMADLESRGVRPLSGALDELLSDPSFKPIPTQAHLLLATAVPDVELADAFDERFKLSEALQRGPVVVVFYYGYFCNHCVSQLFALSKDRELFQELGATIVAISSDPPKLTRERFEKYGPFEFSVLSDSTHRVAELYGTYKPAAKPGEEGDVAHGTFVISRNGQIVWANRGDNPFTDNRTLLRAIAIAEGRIKRPASKLP